MGNSGERQFGRPRNRGVNNVKMHLKRTGWEDIDWIDLAQDRDTWLSVLSTLKQLRFYKMWEIY